MQDKLVSSRYQTAAGRTTQKLGQKCPGGKEDMKRAIKGEKQVKKGTRSMGCSGEALLLICLFKESKKWNKIFQLGKPVLKRKFILINRYDNKNKFLNMTLYIKEIENNLMQGKQKEGNNKDQTGYKLDTRKVIEKVMKLRFF